MRKAWLIGAVAILAAAGALVGVLVSSGSGGSSAKPGTSAVSGSTGSTAPGPGGTSAQTTTASTSTGRKVNPLVPTTTAAIPPPPGPGSPRVRSFMVGTVDDSLAQRNPASARAQVDLSHRAGFDTIVISAGWQHGQTAPTAGVLRGIRNAGAAAKHDHMRLFLVAWNGLSGETPRGGAERQEFATFTAALVTAVPSATGVIVGNEPNLNTFWLPQFGPGGRDVAAAAYEDLLARTYDAVKAASPSTRVIGVALSPRGADRPHGIRPTHSPTEFILDLGRDYRASGRRRPLMDAFAIHPYMISSKIPPTRTHPRTTQITMGDYPKLVTLLDEAFRGTAQRGRTLPILYSEFGVQTVVPHDKLAAYQPGTTPDAADTVSSATQAAYYREALTLAYCQPTVKGLFVFHTFDEFALNGWQSGVYYADRTPKPSLKGFRRAVADLRAGKLTTCR
ncbi:MAG: hypothetical protein ACXVRG_12170 [Gaiellaceae bacterium]